MNVERNSGTKMSRARLESSVRIQSILLTVVMLVLCPSASSIARNLSPNAERIYLGIGLSAPTGTLGEGWNTGFHARAAAGFVIRTSLTRGTFEFVLEAAYHSFGIKKFGNDVKGGIASALQIGIGPKKTLELIPSQLHLFFGAGVGIGFVEISDLTTSGQSQRRVYLREQAVKFYLSPIGGIEIQNRYFISLSYVFIDTDGDPFSYLPFSFGVRF